MNHCSIWNRLVFVLNLCLQAFKSYGLLFRVMREERKNIGQQYAITNSPIKVPVFLL